MTGAIHLVALLGLSQACAGGEPVSRKFAWELPKGKISLRTRQTPMSQQALGLRNEISSGRVFAGAMEVVGARAEDRSYPIDTLVTNQIIVIHKGRRYAANRADLIRYLNLHFGTDSHDWNSSSGRLISVDRQGAALVIPGGGGEGAYSLIICWRSNRRPLIFCTGDVP